jgi:hypothetical protein
VILFFSQRLRWCNSEWILLWGAVAHSTAPPPPIPI